MSPALIIVATVFGVAGYQEARRFGRQYGRTPWGWDPLIWAVVMFLSFLIGLVLIAIAERQGRNAAARGNLSANLGYGQLTTGYAQATSSFGQPALAGAAATPPPAGFWPADPSGRHEYRWWDGQQWTANVSTQGVASQDFG